MESELFINSASNFQSNSTQNADNKSSMVHVNPSSLLKRKDITKHPISKKIVMTVAHSPAFGGKPIIQTIRKEQKINLKTIVRPLCKSLPSSSSLSSDSLLKSKVIRHTSGKSLVKDCSFPRTHVSSESLLRVNNTNSTVKKIFVTPESLRVSSNMFNNHAEIKTSELNNFNKLLNNEKSSLFISTTVVQKDSLFPINKEQTKEGKIITKKLINNANKSQCSILKINSIPDEIKDCSKISVPTNNEFNYHNEQEKMFVKTEIHNSKFTGPQPYTPTALPEADFNIIKDKMSSFNLYSDNTNKTKIKNTNQNIQFNQCQTSKRISELHELECEKLEDNQNNKQIRDIDSVCISDNHVTAQNITIPNFKKSCKRQEESRIGKIPKNVKGISSKMLHRLYGHYSSNSMNIFESILYSDQPFHMLFAKPANTDLWCMRKTNNPLLAGYNPLRGDFAIEYDNAAEELPIIAGKLLDLSQDEGCKDDQKLIKEIAITMTKAYNNRLSERHRRKELIKKYGLMNQRGVKNCLSRHEISVGKSVLKKLMKVSQIHTPDEVELLFASLAITNDIKSYLNKIIYYRGQHGIRTMLDMNIFENERNQEEPGLTRFNVRNVALPETEKRKRIVTQIFHLPRYKDLSPKEADLCSSMRLTPELYLKAKDSLLAECKRSNGLLLKTARKLVKIDVNKTRKIFDLLLENGSIWPP